MKEKLLKIARKLGTPLYTYEAKKIKKGCNELKRNFPFARLYYACKANTNTEVIRLIYRQGFGIETVSPGEIYIARKAGVPVSKITFTCGSISEKELLSVVQQGVKVHLDSLRQVEIFGKHHGGKEISVRLNLQIGAGGHSHLITGGPDSKFGIDIGEIKKLWKLAEKYNLRITGIHQHIGSNILSTSTMLRAVRQLLKVAFFFPDLKTIEFGGGFGVKYRPEEKDFDMRRFAKKFMKLYESFIKKYGRKVSISFEPGRYLMAEAGNLLVEVTDIKKNRTQKFIGVNSGMNHLLRPAMYDSYHEIVNLSGAHNRKEKYTIVGNICESGDVFTRSRIIRKPKIGDILAIKNAGAYGHVMSSEYNSRPKAKEILI